MVHDDADGNDHIMNDGFNGFFSNDAWTNWQTSDQNVLNNFQSKFAAAAT